MQNYASHLPQVSVSNPFHYNSFDELGHVTGPDNDPGLNGLYGTSHMPREVGQQIGPSTTVHKPPATGKTAGPSVFYGQAAASPKLS